MDIISRASKDVTDEDSISDDEDETSTSQRRASIKSMNEARGSTDPDKAMKSLIVIKN